MNDDTRELVKQMCGLDEIPPRVEGAFNLAKRCCDRADGGDFTVREIALIITMADESLLDTAERAASKEQAERIVNDVELNPEKPPPHEVPIRDRPLQETDAGMRLWCKVEDGIEEGEFIGFTSNGQCRVNLDSGEERCFHKNAVMLPQDQEVEV